MDKLDDDVSYSLRRGKDFLLKLLFFIFDVPLISQKEQSPETSTTILFVSWKIQKIERPIKDTKLFLTVWNRKRVKRSTIVYLQLPNIFNKYASYTMCYKIYLFMQVIKLQLAHNRFAYSICIFEIQVTGKFLISGNLDQEKRQAIIDAGYGHSCHRHAIHGYFKQPRLDSVD